MNDFNIHSHQRTCDDFKTQVQKGTSRIDFVTSSIPRILTNSGAYCFSIVTHNHYMIVDNRFLEQQFDVIESPYRMIHEINCLQRLQKTPFHSKTRIVL